jgi:iron complex transport system substrate-binding protein
MKIVSLLPSATEICFALGLDSQLEAVTFECDFPEVAGTLPHATTSAMAGGADAAEIDAAVRRSMDAGQPIYRLDEDLIRRIDPDLVIAQDLCRVCAVPSGHVEEALDKIGRRAAVLSLDPDGLDEVIAGVGRVARATGVADRGEQVMQELRSRIGAVRRATESAEVVRVLTLEWSDPPFVGGHWVPEMVEAARGIDVLGAPRARSRQVSWEEIGEADFDVVVFMPCGYDLAAAVEEGRDLVDRPELAGASRVYATDGSAYFSRPGPRVVDGTELLGWALHPGLFPEPPPGRIERLR